MTQTATQPTPPRTLQSQRTVPAEHLTSDTLRQVSLFAHLPDDQLRWLAELGTVVDLASGDYLCREGETAIRFFVIVSGATIVTKAIGGGDITLGMHQPGDFTGEIPCSRAAPTSRRVAPPPRAGCLSWSVPNSSGCLLSAARSRKRSSRPWRNAPTTLK